MSLRQEYYRRKREAERRELEAEEPTPTALELKREEYKVAPYIEPVLKTAVMPPPAPTPEPEPVGITPAQFEEEYGVTPDIPKEATITKVEETEEGYQIEYVTPAPPPPRPPTIFEWIGQRWEEITHPKPFTLERGYVAYTPIMAPPKKPITPTLIRTVEDVQAALRGYGEPTITFDPFRGIRYEKPFEATAEALEVTMIPIGMVREVEATLGRQPSLIGAIVRTGISPFLGKPTTEALEYYWQQTKEHPLLIGGEILAEILMAKYIWGPAISKIRVPRGSRVDVWLAKHWKWYYARTGGIARGEVALPSLVEPVTMKQLRASELAWQLTQAPRTGGVWLTRVGVAPVKQAVKLPTGRLMATLFEEAKKGFVEPYWKRGLLPYVTQKQVTRLGIIPYIPKAAAVTEEALTPLIVSLGVSAATKAIVQPRRKRRATPIITMKVWQPTLAREREKFRPLTIEVPMVKEKERLITIPKVSQILGTQQITQQLQKQIQKQKLQQIQAITEVDIGKTITALKPIRYRPPRRPRKRRERPILSEAWFLKKHPIMQPSEVARFMLGGAKRKRKVKRKKKRKRRKK